MLSIIDRVSKFKATYILAIIALFVASCRQTKHVPDGQYLVKKNKVYVEGDKLDEEDLVDIIRQPANHKTLGFKLKLGAYNMVDSTKVAKKRIRKNEKLHRQNDKKRAKQKRINEHRIEKARRKNQEFYTKKIIPLKDTLTPRLFVREWMKYKYGEPPVIFDSALFLKTSEQHALYLKKKGYYSGIDSAKVIYKNRKKVKVKYYLTTGPRMFIDSVIVESENPSMKGKYLDYVNNSTKIENLKGKPFDRDMLDDYRATTSKTFRDNQYYGFSASNITYVADTNNLDANGLILTLKIGNRVMYHPDFKDSLITLEHKLTRVRNVYFHISDTTFLGGIFKDTMRALGLNPFEGQYANTIDTLKYQEIWDKKEEKFKGSRMATFYFNEKLFVEAGIIESQNYLEQGEKYKEYYIDRTYTRLVQLGLFQSIKPEIIEILGTNKIDVHYYLVPGKKESFGFEPRVTHSNGFFGLTASIYYLNNNLLGGAQKMRMALDGGFESQPRVFDPNNEETILERQFNTIEIGPSLVFDLPGLFPTKVTALSKRHRPRTVVSTAFNYQKRTEFTRQTFQANYMWKMHVNKTQIFQFGLPFVSLVKFVNIEKQPDFQATLVALNDQFLINSYSDQFIWQDWKFIFEYKNVNKDGFDSKKDIQTYFNGSFDMAGNILGLFTDLQAVDTTGRHQIFGVAYSRFARLDNDLILSKRINKKTSAHFRLLAGGGIPTGDEETSLPFDYSFYGGGSNDNRAWRPRALGPGTYKYLLDQDRTQTQLADIRISASAEYRFSLGSSLYGATFLDAGNVWTFNEDVNRPGGQFTSSWYKELAYSAGVGVRWDLEFFIIRLDFAVPLNNPSVPKASRWVWQSRDALLDELINHYGEAEYYALKDAQKIPLAFAPRLVFGIGYPF